LGRTFVVPPISLVVGQSWLFSASSIKFRIRRGLKSRWVYLAPHDDHSIQLLNLNWMVFGFKPLQAHCT